MKPYKSVEILSIFRVSSHPAEKQSPPIRNFLTTVLHRSLVKGKVVTDSHDAGFVHPNSMLAVYHCIQNGRRFTCNIILFSFKSLVCREWPV